MPGTIISSKEVMIISNKAATDNKLMAVKRVTMARLLLQTTLQDSNNSASTKPVDMLDLQLKAVSVTASKRRMDNSLNTAKISSKSSESQADDPG